MDAGDLFWKSASLPDQDLPQRTRKAKLLVDAFTLHGVDAMTPGEGDLALGVDTYRELTASLPVLAGNLTCGDADWPLTRVVEKQGRTVGFIGVVGEKPKGCDLSDPAAAVAAGVAEVGDVDVVVLLSHGRSSGDEELIASGGVDFVVNGHSRQSYKSPRAIGSGWQLASGSRGKKLGFAELVFLEGGDGWTDDQRTVALQEDRSKLQDRLDVAKQQVADAADEVEQERFATRVAYYEGELARVDADIEAARTAGGQSSHRFKNQLFELDDKYQGHPATDALVDATLDDISALETPGVETAPPDGPFLGSETCRGCHTAQYDQWKTTGHASAYDTLAKDRRHLDADCVSCHTTGYGMGGPSHPAQVGHLKDVGCESCHGPGQEHVGDAAHGKIMNPPAKAVCTGCHDGEQDGGRFVYEEYVLKVQH